jgi:predicted RNA binding protein with dsRBD fold (UPF0201 family)
VETEVRPTESREKVETAVRKIFPTVTLDLVGNSLMGESVGAEAISRFRQLLRQQGILDAARSVMFANKSDNSTKLLLNKQVAFVGRVSFTDGESPLGPIVVTLEAQDVGILIDYLAPRTHEGKPIKELTTLEI